MYCPKCGNSLQEKDKFCSVCGNVVEKKHSFSIQKIVGLCLVFCLLGVAGTWFFLGQEDKGQTLPSVVEDKVDPQEIEDEDAGRIPEEEENSASKQALWTDPDVLAGACVTALQNGDVDAVLEMSDVPEQLACYNWTGNIQRLGLISRQLLFLNDDPSIQKMAESRLQYWLNEKLLILWSSVFAEKNAVAQSIATGSPRPVSDLPEGDLEEYLTLMSKENLGRVQYSVFWSNIPYNAERVLEDIKRSYDGAVTGYREYVILLSCDGSYGVSGITLYQYNGGSWKLHDFVAVANGTTSGGEPIPDLTGMPLAQAQEYILQNYRNLVLINP